MHVERVDPRLRGWSDPQRIVVCVSQGRSLAAGRASGVVIEHTIQGERPRLWGWHGLFLGQLVQAVGTSSAVGMAWLFTDSWSYSSALLLATGYRADCLALWVSGTGCVFYLACRWGLGAGASCSSCLGAGASCLVGWGVLSGGGAQVLRTISQTPQHDLDPFNLRATPSRS